MKFNALITALLLGASGVAAADPGFSAHVTVGMPEHHVVVKDRQFRDIDQRYDGFYDGHFEDNAYHGRHGRLRWNNLSGVYNSTLGEVRLQQEGDRVSGVYAGGGTIDGRVVDNRLFFHWTHAGDEGRGVFIINGRRSLEGMWGMNRSNRDGGRWDLRRVPVSRR